MLDCSIKSVILIYHKIFNIEVVMENLFAFLDKISSTLGIRSVSLHLLFKTLFAIVISYIVWLILLRILAVFEKKIQKTDNIQINTRIFRVIRRAVFYGVILATGTYLIKLFAIGLLEKIFHSLMIILLATPVKDGLLIVLEYIQKNIVDRTKTKVDDVIFDLLDKFSGAIIYATAVILALDVLGMNVMPFIAGAGVAGIAIGFAAKDTLSNLIAGVLLIIDRPFEIGDRIEVWSAPSGSATWGDVIDIGLRATKIKTTDHIIIIIPNNEIMKRDIVNYTSISTKIRVRINVGVAYDADIEKAKDLIKDVAGEAAWISKEPPPKVVVRNFGESSVDLQLRVWIDNARKRMDTISYITDKVKAAFDKNGIEIPYPKRDITIIERSIAEPEKPQQTPVDKTS
ncbi:MAG: mechanosensitive ion channel family protein [Deltaproteobacteria bacterium]|nr:mechanosensitive ion channel family protein [Deltaproteobacteria bacterium]